MSEKKRKYGEEMVKGGCGHSAEDMEFSAVVVTLSVIGYLAIALIAIAVN